MNEHYDVVVLGGGNAGQAAASAARNAGKTVLLMESRDVGGTCPLRGCVPKKVLVAASEVQHAIALAGEHHIEIQNARLDWPGLIARVRTFVEGVAESFEASIERQEIHLVKSAGRFVDANTIDVDGQHVSADQIVVATGSSPRNLPIPGFEHVVTSDELLELSELPESIAFIGGGVISLELGQVLCRAGARVVVLEVMPQLLPRVEPEIVMSLTEESRRIGMEIHTGVQIESITEKEDGYHVCYRLTDEEHSIVAGLVANGAGRVADLQDLDLAKAGIETDARGGVVVDEYLRSVSHPHVFVAGDSLTTSPQLSPIATYEGRIVGHNLNNEEKKRPDYRYIPSAIFTVPAIATVGKTEAEARDEGLEFEVKLNDMRDWRSSKSYAETIAFSKVLVENQGGRIIGAHVIGHGAQEIIHFIALGMKTGQSAQELGEFVCAYPTFSSDVKFML